MNTHTSTSARVAANCASYTTYKERFRMPGLEAGLPEYTGTNMWYSFNFANIHFVAVSTEPSWEVSRKGTQQYNWLKEDLHRAVKKKQKGEIDWIIVVGHRPMYCSYNWSDCCNECKQKGYFDDWDQGSFAAELRQSMEELLLAYQVDAYLSGHIHAYERMWPVYDSIYETSGHPDLYINPRYPVHVMSGAAGNMEGSKK